MTAEPLVVDAGTLLVGSAALVQRERHQALLRHALAGPGGVVVVEGEAGAGKSRLVQEVTADRPRVWTGHCYPHREPSSLAPVVEALRTAAPYVDRARLTQVAGHVRALVPELADALPRPPEGEVDPASSRHQLFRGLVEVIAAICPAVLVLEDLHWADEVTGEFLHVLLAQAVPDLQLVLTYRREDLPAASPVRTLASRVPAGATHVRIEVPPLDAAGVGAMIAGLLGAEVTGEFAEFVHERTGGLPYAIEEMLGLLTDRRDLVRIRGRWARHALAKLEVPVGIRDAITERISRLPAAARDVVAAVAVLGPDATPDRVRRLVGGDDEEFAGGFDAAVRSALVREGSGPALRFRHALARDAAYHDLGPLRRRDLHREVAGLLLAEPRPAAAALTLHLREAGDPRWVEWAEAAADQALAVFDELTAFELLRDVVATGLVTGPRLVAVTVKLATAGDRAHLPAEAAEVVRDVIARAPARGAALGELWFLLGLLLYTAGDQVPAYEALARSLTELPPGAPLAARAMTGLSFPYVAGVPVGEHLAWVDRALDAVAATDDPEAHAAVHGNAAIVRLAVGLITPAEADRHVPRGDEPGARAHTSRVLCNLAHAAAYLGEYGAARAFLAEADALEARLGGGTPQNAALRAYLDFVTGTWTGLGDRTDEIFDRTPAVQQPQAFVTIVVALLRAAVDGADTDELRAVGADALDGGGIPVALAAYAALADELLDAGATGEAAEVVAKALEVLRAKDIWVWSGEIVPAAARVYAATDPAAATALVAEAARGLDGVHSPAAHAGLLVARGLATSDATERHGLLGAAAAAWAALPRPATEAATLELLAASYAAAGEVAEAVAAWRRAAETYESLGATRRLARVTRSLREHGERVPTKRGGSTGAALTPREQEVAELVAAGCSNREIADRLYLSPRTVEHNVERAMRKLGARNRAALSALLARRAD